MKHLKLAVTGLTLLLSGVGPLHAANPAPSDDINIPSFSVPDLSWLKSKGPKDLWKKYQPESWVQVPSLNAYKQQGADLQQRFTVLKDLPISVITVALPEPGDIEAIRGAAVAVDRSGKILSGVERTAVGLTSHIGLTAGLTGAVGLTSSPLVGVLAGVGNSLGATLTLGDVVSQGFRLLSNTFWSVNIRRPQEIGPASPVTFMAGNPAQNTLVAGLNPSLPVRFQNTGGIWSIVSSQGSFSGHVGMISLTAQGPLDQLQLDTSAGPTSPVNVIIGGTDAQGTLAAVRLLEPSQMSTAEEVHTLFNLLQSALMRAMFQQRLEKWQQINGLVQRWGQSLDLPNTANAGASLDIPSDLRYGVTIIVTADAQGFPASIKLLRH